MDNQGKPLDYLFLPALLRERYLLASVHLLELELVGTVVEVLERVAARPDRPDALDEVRKFVTPKTQKNS